MNFKNYAELWHNDLISQVMRNTVVMVVATSTMTVAFSFAISLVIGSRLATPRIPSVPKSLRIVLLFALRHSGFYGCSHLDDIRHHRHIMHTQNIRSPFDCDGDRRGGALAEHAVSDDAENQGATRLVAANDGAIRSTTLDGSVRGKVDFIKIDAEGMELEVLAGAARIVRESRPKIMIEVFNAHTGAFNRWLAANRYRVVRTFQYVNAATLLIEPMA